jgi:hypothetical protein
MANDSMPRRDRYHLNAPGAFYVERDMCIICRAPEHAAPELMGFFEDPEGSSARSHCYFKRQPQSVEETRHAVEAVHVSCCRAVRYGGSDRTLLSELFRRGDGDACDEA